MVARLRANRLWRTEQNIRRLQRTMLVLGDSFFSRRPQREIFR
jgi:hypothetical protein